MTIYSGIGVARAEILDAFVEIPVSMLNIFNKY
jgi:hypothetical protein